MEASRHVKTHHAVRKPRRGRGREKEREREREREREGEGGREGGKREGAVD